MRLPLASRRGFGALLFVAVALFPQLVSAQETLEYYGTDALGSVRVVFDSSGGITGWTEFMPFGEEVSSAGAIPVNDLQDKSATEMQVRTTGMPDLSPPRLVASSSRTGSSQA